jgi:hypothetical protein
MAKKGKSSKKQTTTKVESVEEHFVSEEITSKRAYSKRNTEEKPSILFSQKHYIFIGIGILTVLIGFFLMSGGAMPDENTWEPSVIYSFRRITLAPFVVLLGLAFVGYALFFNTPEDKEELENYKPEEE